MVGAQDAIGIAAMAYFKFYGDRAHVRVDDDISSAVGQHEWSAAHTLNRVKLRLMRLRIAGQLNAGPQGQGRRALPA